MTDERALKIALMALHEQRQRGLAGTVTREEWTQAVFVLEGLLESTKMGVHR